MRRLITLSIVVAVLALGASPAAAARAEGGAHFIVGAPQGVFADVAPTGYGLQVDGVYHIDPQGWFGIRGDVGYLNYGNEERRVPLSNTVVLVDVRVRTSHNLVTAGLGPQFSVPEGPIRPYLFGTVGLGYFFTETSVSGSNSLSEPFASSTNFSNAVFAWSAGGGVQVPFNRQIALDLGAEYRAQKDAEYLTKGSIIENSDGTVTIKVHRSDADLVIFHVGVTLFTPL